jgi:transcriptional regulator with GAF, ATPase, and Fis domain
MSIDRIVKPDTDLTHDAKLLEIVANILADAVNAIREEIEEKEQLVAENKRLKIELDKHFHPGNLVGNCSSMRAATTA